MKANKIRKIASRLLPHHGNAKLTSPPGRIPVGEGRPILVKSKMRSGTHLLIDLLLNNFPQLRGEALYVELDHAVLAGMEASDFKNLGQCLCKTHCAGLEGQESKQSIVEEVAGQAIIVEPFRPLEEIEKSMRAFVNDPLEVARYMDETKKFDLYWQPYECTKFPFVDLVTHEGNDRIITEFSELTGLASSKKRIYNRAKKEAKQVLLDKLMTRLLGVKKRRVNTTIQFNG